MPNIGRRLLTTVAVSSILLTVLPLGVHAGGTGARPAMGVQFHGMWDYASDSERIAVLDKLAATGVGWIRVDVAWCSLQDQSRDSYSQWYVDRLDRIVDAANARSLRVLGTIYCTPGWANGHPGDWETAAPLPPDDPNDFGAVAEWLATRYRGRVSAWEVWNEPNLSQFFKGDAAAYVRVLRAGYGKFKAGDPNTQVVLGGPSYNDVEWLQQVYAAGAKGHFDVMAVHPYMSPSNLAPETNNGTIWTISAVSMVHDLMQKMGDGAKSVWFTEFGWSSHSNTGSEPNWKIGVTEQQQADYLVRAVKYVAANYPYVTNMFWYNERNRQTSDVHEANFGLLNRDFSQKPAYAALKNFMSGTTGTSSSPTNRLRNGGFEGGTIGWETKGADLTTVDMPYSGNLSGRVAIRGERSRLNSQPRALPDKRTTLTLDGFVKPGSGSAEEGFRVVMREVLRGSLLGRRAVTFTVQPNVWQPFPSVVYRTTGRDRARMVVRVRPSRGATGDFLVDQFRVVDG